MLRVLALLAAITLAACNRQDWPQFSKAEYQRVSAADRSSTPPPIASAPQSYADAVDRVSPAVVTIRSAKRVREAQQFPFLDDPFFRQFFGNPRQRSPRGGNYETQHALGSGVIVRADGHILTNHHVVDGADQITVELPSRQTYSAKLVGSDAPSDLAVLKIDASNLPTLPLGDSNRVRVGDVCLAVGNPLGVGETVTSGIISAKGRATGLSDGSFEDFLQTDAAINQGNSGGALVNTAGELIGINSQILSPSGGNIGIGFAIPSNMAKTVMSQLVNGGKVRRGKLGVSIQAITSDLAASLGIKEVRGVLISGVSPGGPADHAGIKTGDIVTAVNGQPTNDPNELRNRIASTEPGAQVTLTLERSGKEMQVKATLAELTAQEAQSKQSGSDQGGGEGGSLGLTVQPLTPDDAAQLGLSRATHGLVVQSVDPSGPAAETGIQSGDVIVEVNRQPVVSVDELRGALRKSGSRPALLLINRGGQTHFVTVRPR
jgi:Do/DeqQ family serine protease